MALILVRHGDTTWSRTAQRSGATDVPLTHGGEAQARGLGDMLRGWHPSAVLVSPRLRARRTAELAGWRNPHILDDLAEWDYGIYEGCTTAEIQAERAKEGARPWSLWRDGAPGGEDVVAVGARADRVLGIARELLATGEVVMVAHAHVLRVLAARWLGLAPQQGAAFMLDPAAIGILDTKHGRPAVRRWNISAAGVLGDFSAHEPTEQAHSAFEGRS